MLQQPQHILASLIKSLSRSERHDKVRRSCLRHVVEICSVHSALFNTQPFFQMCRQYIDDPFAVVRKVAYQSIVEYWTCHPEVAITTGYQDLVKAFKDDYEPVRLMGLEMASCLINTLNMRPLTETMVVSLEHQIFTLVCDQMNDSSCNVRKHTCTTLSLFTRTPSTTLTQTLSKKPLTEGQTRQRQPADAYEGEGDVSVTELGFKAVDRGSCGAFILALEDESMQVRLAAICMGV